jgi:hypothetical protein
MAADVAAKLRAQYPLITTVFVGQGIDMTPAKVPRTMLQMNATSTAPLSAEG